MVGSLPRRVSIIALLLGALCDLRALCVKSFFLSFTTTHFSLSSNKKTGKGAPSAGRMIPCFLRWLLHVRCLRPFRSLDNLELYRISFLQAAVAISQDCGIMNKNIWTIVAPYEAIPL
jgi:hypothetical protein